MTPLQRRRIKRLDVQVRKLKQDRDRWYAVVDAAYLTVRKIRSDLQRVERRLKNGKQRDR